MVSTADSEEADMGVVLRLRERRCASRDWALPLLLGAGVGIARSKLDCEALLRGCGGFRSSQKVRATSHWPWVAVEYWVPNWQPATAMERATVDNWTLTHTRMQSDTRPWNFIRFANY
jgi:hypothetical protein